MEMLFFLLTGCVLELCLGECGQQFRGRLGTLRLGIENRIDYFFLLIYYDIPILFKNLLSVTDILPRCFWIQAV